MIADLPRVLLLLLMAATMGLLVNLCRPHPLPWSASAAQPEAAAPAITLAEMQAAVAAKDAWIIDARPAAFYRLGHIPGAISLPRDHAAESAGAFLKAFAAQPGRRIILYCTDPECPDSRAVFGVLAKRRPTGLLLFPEGWKAWSQARLPKEVGS